MQIEAGKSYRARDDEKWIDARPDKRTGYWGLLDENGVRYRFHSDGKFEHGPAHDLIAEWTDEPAAAPAPGSPVRRRTVTEIVPGTYGPVHVISQAGDCARVRLQLEVLTAAELRHAATIFTALAGALEDTGK